MKRTPRWVEAAAVWQQLAVQAVATSRVGQRTAERSRASRRYWSAERTRQHRGEVGPAAAPRSYRVVTPSRSPDWSRPMAPVEAVALSWGPLRDGAVAAAVPEETSSFKGCV